MFIESHTGLMRHPKLGRLARQLNVPKAHALGLLHAMWHAVAEDPVSRVSGDISHWTDRELSQNLGWNGRKTRLISALTYDGKSDALGPWIDTPDSTTRRVHDWVEYSHYLRKNIADRDRKRRARVEKNLGHGADNNTDDAADGERTVSGHNAPESRSNLQPTTYNLQPSSFKESQSKVEGESNKESEQSAAAAAGEQDSPVPARETNPAQDSKRQDVQSVVDAYLRHFPKRHKGAEALKPKIKTRLKTWSVSEMIQAIDNVCASQWHRDNRQASLDLIVRNDAQVDKYLNMTTQDGDGSREAQVKRVLAMMGEDNESQ